jgi:hypothetical protein
MTDIQARTLTLGRQVMVVGITYCMKKDQRQGPVTGLKERGNIGPLVNVQLPDGRDMEFDCHWIHTRETLGELLEDYLLFYRDLTPVERRQVNTAIEEMN